MFPSSFTSSIDIILNVIRFGCIGTLTNNCTCQFCGLILVSVSIYVFGSFFLILNAFERVPDVQFMWVFFNRHPEFNLNLLYKKCFKININQQNRYGTWYTVINHGALQEITKSPTPLHAHAFRVLLHVKYAPSFDTQDITALIFIW